MVVIEDDATTRELVQLALADAGYTVTVARDGAAALALVWQPGCVPDVIVVDVRMPLIDGRTCRRMQQGYPQWRTIPVVVLSAHTDVHATAHALGIGGRAAEALHGGGVAGHRGARCALTGTAGPAPRRNRGHLVTGV